MGIRMSAPARGSLGAIRSATLADAYALTRLCAALDLDVLPLGAADVMACLDRGHLLVLDLGAGTLGAAAYVSMTRANGACTAAHIEFLAIHPALAGSGAEDRVAAAILATCEAAGCDDVDVRWPRTGRWTGHRS